MADERLREMLRPLDGAATPDESFGEALFAQIAPLALAAGRRDRTWYGRVATTIRTAARPLPSPAANQLRTAIVLATVLALLLALAAIVASRRPDPLQIVLGSEAVYRDPPSFDITVGYSDGAIRRFRYDGADVMRLDAVKGAFGLRPEGTFILADVGRHLTFEWDAAGGTVLTAAIAPGMRPIAPLDLRWGADVGQSGEFSSSCLSWEYIQETHVLARPVHHVRCATGLHDEYWVDIATGFVLRSTAVPTDDDRIFLTGEVMEFALGVTIDPAVLVVQGPHVGAIMPGGDARLEPGTRVVSNRFTRAFAATPGEGWRSWGTADNIVGFVRGPDWNDLDGGAVLVLRLTKVTDVDTGTDRPLAPGPEAVFEWLREHPYFELGEERDTFVSGLAARSVSIAGVPPDDIEARCPLPAAGDEPAPCWRWFPQGTNYWFYGGRIDPGGTAIALDVDGVTVTILSWANGPSKDAHLAAIEELIDSIEFLD